MIYEIRVENRAKRLPFVDERDTTTSTTTTATTTTTDVIQKTSIHESQPTTLLIPTNKPTLAPIASCETLSEFESPEVCDSPEDRSTESSDSSDETYTTTAAITINPGGSSAISVTAKSSGLLLFPPSHTHLQPPSSTPPTVTFKPIGMSSTDDFDEAYRSANNSLQVPYSISTHVSSDSLLSANGSYGLGSSASSDTLVPGSPGSGYSLESPLGSPKRVPSPRKFGGIKSKKALPIKIPSNSQLDALALSPATSPKFKRPILPIRRATSPICTITPPNRVPSPIVPRQKPPSPAHSPVGSPKFITHTLSSPNIIPNLRSKTGKCVSACCNIFSSIQFCVGMIDVLYHCYM